MHQVPINMFEFCRFFLTISLICNFGISVLSEVPRPRGVPVSHANLYPPADDFTCLDGLKTIKFTQVNDDFCDCADGSDEPGTSACPAGTFHCTNVGYRPKNLPSSRVNDGICDCCDASDEYSSNAAFVNNCNELGKEARNREKLKIELARKGHQLRAELIIKGKALKSERKLRLNELEEKKKQAMVLKEEKDKIRKESEELENEALHVYRQAQETEKRETLEKEAEINRKEADEIFNKFDLDNDGYVGISEMQTRIAFDKDRDGVVSTEEAMFFLDGNEQIDREPFITLAWPRIKPYLMLDSGLFKPPRVHVNTQGDLADEHQDDQIDPTASDKNTDEEASHDDDEEGTTEGSGVEETDNDQTEYDPETQDLIEKANSARNEYSEADRTVRDIETEIQDIKELMGKDCGIEDEFSALDGECFNYEDREYVYKFCPFDRVSQQPKSGGSETRLGIWDRWSGKTNKYTDMVYSNGASCWNGPQRSATISLECGLEHKLTSVTEPNRCEYHFVFHTSAACQLIDETDAAHDEL